MQHNKTFSGKGCFITNIRPATILALLFYLSAFAQPVNKISEKLSLIPDPNLVTKRFHTYKIKELIQNSGKEEQLKKTHDYLDTLEIKGLLEFASELSTEKDFESSVKIIVPHLQKKLSEYFPSAEICDQIKDKTKHTKYRAFLIDITTKLQKKDTQQIDGIPVEASISIEVCETLISTAEDEDNDVELRRYALLQVGRENSNLYSLKKLKPASIKAEAWDNRLLKLYQSDNPPTIKGAVITAMRRSRSGYIEDILNTVLADPQKFEDIIVRHAVVSVAKSDRGNKYVSQLRKIALANYSVEVYKTTIYALGVIGNTEAICAISDVYNKHGYLRTMRSAFRKNEKTIIGMLAPGKDDYTMSCGILAVKVGRIAAATDLVKSIAAIHENASLRKDAQEILDEIETYELGKVQHEEGNYDGK